MSGLDAVVSGGIEYQNCKTWSYSARLNAAVASLFEGWAGRRRRRGCYSRWQADGDGSEGEQ